MFDEVDAGIGGRTADPVGRSLWALARNHQVLVVTHLPQIAAHADAHFRIAKRERDGRTVTEVEQLDREGRIVELAAMLGGGVDLLGGTAGSDERPTTKRGLVAVGPGPRRDGDGELDAEVAAELAAANAEAGPPPAAGAALAAARELLDAAEAWRGRPVRPGLTPGRGTRESSPSVTTELERAVDAYLTFLAVERGLAAATIRAYRGDLADFAAARRRRARRGPLVRTPPFATSPRAPAAAAATIPASRRRASAAGLPRSRASTASRSARA